MQSVIRRWQVVGSPANGGTVLGWLVAWAVLVRGAAPVCGAGAELIVADQVGNRIVVLDEVSGAYKRTLWSTDDVVQPAAMTFGPGGDLYFANRLSGDVLRIARADLGGSNVTAAPFASVAFPGSMAYHAATNSLLVGEFGVYPGGPLGDNIFVYDAAGAVQQTLTLPEVGIAGIAFDAAGDLYASGFFTSPAAAGRIYKFSGPPSWTLQGPFAPMPYPYAELQGAAGIAFDSAGDMFVAGLITANSGDVVKFDLDQGQLAGQQRVGDFIAFPSGLLMLSGDELLVTSLGFGPTSGSLYRFNTQTGARSLLLRGDFDGSGVVDAADFAQWQTSFETNALADADFDGDSDGSDFLAWQRGLGNTSVPDLFSPSAVVVYRPPVAAQVPEPSTAIVTGLAVASMRSFRRYGRAKP
jgi:hypothetical protein